MSTPSLLDFDDLVVGKLEGAPPPGFDCGRDPQTRFPYEHAWHDQRQRVSATYLYQTAGTLAAYTSVCMDAIPLGRRERPAAIRFHDIPALKLAQLGVHLSLQGRGYGAMAVADVIGLAIERSRDAGCRYLTLDARPDLVEWYRGLGFEVNKLRQKQRITAAGARNPDEIPVSMRFDLREV